MKNLKRLLSLLLCLVMVVGLVPMTAFAVEVTAIEITLPHKAGETLSRASGTVPAGAGYTISSFDKLYVYETAGSSTNTWIGSDTQAELVGGNVVQGNLLIAPQAGYSFDFENLTAIVNGKPATAGQMYGYPYITFEYTVEENAPAKTPITSVDTRLMQYPATDKDISGGFAINSCDPVSSAWYTGYATIKVCDTNSNTFSDWTNATGKYAAGKYYMVATEVRANDGYAFGSSLTKTIGGLDHDDRFDSQFTNTDAIQTIVHIYGPLAEPKAVTSFAFTVPEPVVGEKTNWNTWSVSGTPSGSVKNDESGFYVSDTNPVDRDDLTYMPDGTEFQAGKYYVFLGFAVPTDGYQLTGSTTKTVNGASHDTRFDEGSSDDYGMAARVWGPLEAASTPEIWVGGVGMVSGDYLAQGASAPTTTKPADNYTYYKDGKLTLHNYSYSGAGLDGCVVLCEGNLSIELEGANALTTTEIEDATILADGNLIIGGNGNLALSSNDCCILSDALTFQDSCKVTADSTIYAFGDLNVKDTCTVILNGNGCLSQSTSSGSLNISGGTVTVTATNNYGIYASGDINISNGTVTVTAREGSGYSGQGIYSFSGDIEITGGTVTVDADNNGIYAYYNLTISGGTVNVTAKVWGLMAQHKKLTINGGNIDVMSTATGADDDDYYALFDSSQYGSLTFGEGLSVQAATEPNGTFVAYNQYGNKTYDHVKIDKAAPITYTVTFDSDGGSAVASQTVNAGETATKPADPTKSGYTFKGWTQDGTAYDFDTAVNSNIELKASWEEDSSTPLTKYNVWVAGTQVTSANASDVLDDGATSYDAATNTLMVKNDIAATGENVCAIKATTEDDFTVDIDGSVTISSEEGNGIDIQNKAIVTGDTLTITADSYGIRADEIAVNGGTYIVSGWRGLLGKSGVTISNATVTITATNNAIYSYNDKSNISISNSTVIATSTKSRSIFIEESGEETITISNSTVTVTGSNCAVYAPKFEVTGNSDVELKATTTATPDSDYCALSGCGDNFIVAETLDVLASTETDGSNPVPYVKDDRVTYDWVKIAAPAVTTYTVTFNSDGGSAVAAQTVESGKTATKPADPTKSGYTFKGWFLGDDKFDFGTPVTVNITLKAIWETTTPKAFTDVPSNAYYYEAVLWAVEYGITTGTGDGTTFKPNEYCTRGQVVTFLWRAMEKPEPTETENPFVDVKSSDYFYKAVLWAVEKGITTGTGDGTTFKPNEYCTRGQVVTFLWRTLKDGIPCKHVYDNACDAKCNVCGATRTPDAHVYSNDCDDACNVCGLTRDPSDHVYTDDCDATCDSCGATRTVPHAYENGCDKVCNGCGQTRETEHEYKVHSGGNYSPCIHCGNAYVSVSGGITVDKDRVAPGKTFKAEITVTGGEKPYSVTWSYYKNGTYTTIEGASGLDPVITATEEMFNSAGFTEIYCSVTDAEGCPTSPMDRKMIWKGGDLEKVELSSYNDKVSDTFRWDKYGYYENYVQAIPVGGVGTYTYAWEYSDNNSSWNKINGTSIVGGITFGIDASTGGCIYRIPHDVLDKPLYLRVTVTDEGGQSVTSESCVIWRKLESASIIANGIEAGSGHQPTFNVKPIGGNGEYTYYWKGFRIGTNSYVYNFDTEWGNVGISGRNAQTMKMDKEWMNTKLGETAGAVYFVCYVTCDGVQVQAEVRVK